MFTIFVFIYKYFVSAKNLIGLVFIVYIGSYFQYGIAQGGLFTLASFLFLFLLYLKLPSINPFYNKLFFIRILINIIIISNFIGYLFKNESSLIDLILGAISFMGLIMIFNTISALQFSKLLYGNFVKISFFVMLYSLLISLNKLFMIYNSPLPIFGTSTRWGSQNLGGTLGPSPIAGELGLLFLGIVLPLFFAKGNFLKDYNISRFIVPLFLIVSLLTLILAASRSTIILAAATIILISIISLIKKRKFKSQIKVSYIFTLLLIGLITISISSYMNMDYVLSRFENVEVDKITIESLTTGEGINRTTAFEVGEDMIKREHWFIGYGWGVGESNRIAWFGDSSFFRSDPHSLYLSLFPIWGWIGSIAYLLILLFITTHLFLISLRTNDYPTYLIGFGLFVANFFFLINEYKITSMGYPHYFMITWILHGFCISFIVDNKKQKRGLNNEN